MESVLTMATVLLIMSASTIFGWILAKQQIPQALAKAFLEISDSKVCIPASHQCYASGSRHGFVEVAQLW